MPKDSSSLPPCDSEIFHNGEPIMAMWGPSVKVEAWVKEIAKKAKARVDWHITGGMANILHLGDPESRARVEKAIDELMSTCPGTHIQRYSPGDVGLYRAGVTDIPKGTIAVSTESGSNEFLVKPQ